MLSCLRFLFFTVSAKFSGLLLIAIYLAVVESQCYIYCKYKSIICFKLVKKEEYIF